MLFYVGSGVWIILGLQCLSQVKKFYGRKEPLPLYISIELWTVDTIHFLLVVISSLFSVWILPINKIFALIGGLFLLGSGIGIMLSGMIEFQSLRRISGGDTSRLVTTGIYQWSRNPQYVGWPLTLLGIALMGRSALAFLFTAVFMIALHLYTIWMEEPYLEQIFGEPYQSYKLKTARYIGIPKRI